VTSWVISAAFPTQHGGLVLSSARPFWQFRVVRDGWLRGLQMQIWRRLGLQWWLLSGSCTFGFGVGRATSGLCNYFWWWHLQFHLCFSYRPRDMSHLGFIRGFSYSKTYFICTLFWWIMHGVASGYFAAWYLRLRVQMVCRTWSSWQFKVGQVWSIWKHWPGKKGEATRCDSVVVVLVTNSPVPGRNS